MRLTGAELTIRLLERQGVRVIAGIPGGANLPLYDALSHSRSIRHVLARHEQGAAFIAQGMSRVQGTPGVCFATSGPGATNLMTGIADAKLDSIPLVCITGQVPSSMIGTDAFQEVDTFGMSMPITKHNYLVRSAEDLLEVVPAAFRIAAGGRPGPVLIDIPKDVQKATVDIGKWPAPGLPERASPSAEQDLLRAAELINAAERPVVYLGGGVIAGGAWDVVRDAAEKIGAPIVSTLMGLGAIPTTHELYLGMLGMHGARHVNLALDECDLLLVAGARFDDRATGKIEEFCPRAGVVHIDIDASELGKIRRPSVGVRGDVGEALRRMMPHLRPDERAPWHGRIAELRRMHPCSMSEDACPDTPWGLVREIAGLAGEDAIVATDVGQHQMWVAQAYPFTRPRSWLTSGGLGTMGFGLPAAIGAALACPDRHVVCFTGDGSLLMNMQELATAVEEDVNVKIVLMNNGTLGLVRQQQTLFYGNRLFGSTFRHTVDFPSLARSLGMPALDLGESDAGCAVEDLRTAFGSRGPCLINIPVDADHHVVPMVPPGAANRDMIGGGRGCAA